MATWGSVDFRPFDYGNVMANAENIKNSRQRRNILANQEQRAQQQFHVEQQRGEQRFNEEQQVRNTELAYRAFSEISRDPVAIQRWTPVLKQAGFFRADFDPSTIPTDQLMSGARDRAQEYGEVLQNIQRMSQAQGGRIGQYNPGDYTPESWAKATQGGRVDPSQLVRYESPQVVTVAGAPGLAGRSGGGGGFRPLSSLPVEAEADKTLAAASEEGKQRVREEYIPRIESEKLKAVEAAKKEVGRPKALRSAEATSVKTEMLDNVIDDAKEQAGFWTTGFMGQRLSGLGGTPAHDLANTLNTIKANIGFDKLQEMRDSSPTGGALGQVTEQENRLLQAVWGALEQSQSETQFKVNLERVRKQVKQSWERVSAAYKKDYGEALPEELMPTAPGAPVQIQGQSDYDSLPSGTQFIGPDGVLRVKP